MTKVPNIHQMHLLVVGDKQTFYSVSVEILHAYFLRSRYNLDQTINFSLSDVDSLRILPNEENSHQLILLFFKDGGEVTVEVSTDPSLTEDAPVMIILHTITGSSKVCRLYDSYFVHVYTVHILKRML